MAPSPCRPGCGLSPRCATHRRRQCSRRPPVQTQAGSSSCRRCWPASARCRDRGDSLRVPPAPGVGRGWPAAAGRHWPPGGGRRRLFGCGRGAPVVASVGCSLFLVGFLSRKPLSQMQRSTFLPIHHAATLISSVDWGQGIDSLCLKIGHFIIGSIISVD